MSRLPLSHVSALESGDAVERSLKVLDLTIPTEIHKAGLCYLGAGQHREHEMMMNTYGSPGFIHVGVIFVVASMLRW
jgi:hypothetical protein